MEAKLRLHDRVEDIDSRRRGRVIYVYELEEAAELVAVLYDDTDRVLAVHVDDVRKVDGR